MCRVTFGGIGHFTRIQRVCLDYHVCTTGPVVRPDPRPCANSRRDSIALVAFHTEPGFVFPTQIMRVGEIADDGMVFRGTGEGEVCGPDE
tara:strand:+ start:5851 stop:6120 length:270 start_codon:yes stop_codon:yes gene_type:complete